MGTELQSEIRNIVVQPNQTSFQFPPFSIQLSTQLKHSYKTIIQF